VNAKNTIAELLKRGVLPIVNENDTVAVEELQVGDNDNLAAYVAVLAEADLLVICSDVDGFYSADPREDPDAERIEVVDAITDEIRAMAGGSHHASATGGMRTKLEAAEKATDRGIDTVLIDGTDGDHLDALGRGEMPGTLFRRADAGRRLSGRKHWMLHALPAEGSVTIDDGAAHALRERGASLLPAGIVNVEGTFARGDAVRIQTEDASRIAKGITQYSADELRRIRGRQSHDLSTLLDRPDAATTDYVVHRDDLALTREARR
jgi:glutamate 5-kinase